MPRVANDEVTVSNMALRHLAIGKMIQSIDEPTQEAKACKLFFQQTRDEVLGDFAWPFATAVASLALVAGSPTVPATSHYQYCYRIPNDCLRVRFIRNPGGRVDTRQSRVPFRLSGDDEGGLIWTDLEPTPATSSTPALPELEYTVESEDPNLWPPDFAQSVALKLAAYIAPSLTGGDPNKLGQRALQFYATIIASAAAAAFNQEGADELPDSEFIRARDGR